MTSDQAIKLLHPTPLEYFKAPTEFTGEYGTNRAPHFVIKQITASNDLEAVQTWLLEFSDSPQTQRSYRKEAERLLLWSIIEKNKAFSSLTRDDLRDYQKFLADPQPKNIWCGLRKPRHHAHWRPFEGALSTDSVAQAMSIINALFSYLVEAGYLSGNPLGLIRRQLKKRRDQQQKIVERYLEQPLWEAIVTHIQSLPQESDHEKKQYERIRFLFTFFYLLGPRVSEVATNKMNSLKQIRGKWWWFVTGKGNKTEKIPVSDTMLKAILRYRQFYGLPHFPLPDETNFIFMNFNGTKGVTANMIYRIVKQFFLDCAKTFEKTRPEFAMKLKKASTHWLRHTSITHQTDAGIELRYIKRNARHESVETTMLYQHADEDHWHTAMSSHTTTFDEIIQHENS